MTWLIVLLKGSVNVLNKANSFITELYPTRLHTPFSIKSLKWVKVIDLRKNTIFYLGIGFIISSVVGLLFPIQYSVVFGLTIFATMVTLSEFMYFLENKFKDKFFQYMGSLLMIVAIPVVFGLPLLVLELFPEAEYTMTRLSVPMAIFSLGLTLVMLEK